MGAGTAITTPAANIGMGGTTEGGATGTLDVRGGSMTFAGTDTSLNFGSGSLSIADGVSFASARSPIASTICASATTSAASIWPTR
ncbi:MAG: hypothetical protein IPK39_14760 [Sulfuritalea sp.]|nr:hypothetical protein [Sulfuritalea sp.]